MTPPTAKAKRKGAVRDKLEMQKRPESMRGYKAVLFRHNDIERVMAKLDM